MFISFKKEIQKILVCIIIFCSCSSAFALPKDYIIGQPRSGPFAELAALILTEAYQRIGMEVEFNLLPGQRSLVSANSGMIDADMFRIDRLNEKYPNIIKIPESFLDAKQTAFSKRPSTRIADWDSLRPYHVIYRRGHKAIEFNTKDKDINTIVVTDNENMFKMLNYDRGDIVIDEFFMGLSIIKKLELNNIKPLSPPLSEDPLYHYVHKQHLALVPKLANAFKEMKKDKTIEKLFNQTLKNFEMTH